ncbi:MAG: primase-helicase family protein [Hyphomicrobiaceae bacterium]
MFRLSTGKTARTNKFDTILSIETLDAAAAKFGLHATRANKDGEAYVAATLLGGVRNLKNVQEVHFLVFDVDGEMSIEDADALVGNFDRTAWLVTTHSHKTDRTEVVVEHYKKWAAENKQTGRPTLESLRAYLVAKGKGWLVERGLTFDPANPTEHVENKGNCYIVRHRPLDKFRVIFPLSEPINIPALDESTNSAVEVYKDIYHAVGNAVGLPFDHSCSDPCRLFYFPSCPAHLQDEKRALDFDGALLDWREFRGIPRQGSPSTADTNEAETIDREQATGDSTTEDRECAVGLYDLRAWARTVHAFDVAGLVAKYLPDVDRRERVRGGFTITCPFEAEHSAPGGDGTFCDNANGAGQAWVIRCSHNACVERTRLDLLKGWLDTKVITIGDLEAYSGVKVPLVDKVSVADFDSLIDAFDNRTTDEQLTTAVALLCRIDDEFARASAYKRLVEAVPKRVTEDLLQAAIKKEQKRIADTTKALKTARAEWAKTQRSEAVFTASTELTDRFKWILDAGGYWDVETGQMRAREHVYDDVLSVLDAKDLDITPKEALLLNPASKFIRIGYKPGAPESYKDEKGRRSFNTYIPPTLEAGRGDPTPIIRHVQFLFGYNPDGGTWREAWGNYDAAECKHFLDVLAYKVQKPGAKVLHAMLIHNEHHGVGRSSFATKVLAPIFGLHNVSHPTHEQIKEGRADFVERKNLVVVHEIYDVDGKMEVASLLKPMLSEPTVSVHLKFLNRYEVENVALFLMFTNIYNALYIENHDRRYFMYASKATPRSEPYYKALNAVMDGDGPADFYRWLLERDVSYFNPHAHAPMTQAKLDAIEASKGEATVQLEELYDMRKPPFDRDLINITSASKALKAKVDGNVTRNRLTNLLRGKKAVPLDQKGGVDVVVVGKDGGTKRESMRLWALRDADFWRDATPEERGYCLRLGWTADQVRETRDRPK